MLELVISYSSRPGLDPSIKRDGPLSTDVSIDPFQHAHHDSMLFCVLHITEMPDVGCMSQNKIAVILSRFGNCVFRG